MKRIISLLFLILCIGMVNAWSSTTFNNSLSTEGLVYPNTIFEDAGGNFVISSLPLGITILNDSLYVLLQTELKEYYKNGSVKNFGFGDIDLPGLNAHPYALTSNSSNMFVVDYVDNKIYVYDRRSGYRYSISLNKDLDDPQGIFMKDNNFWITDFTYQIIYEFYPNGTYTGNNFTSSGVYLITGGFYSFNEYYIIEKTESKVWVYNSSLTNVRNYTTINVVDFSGFTYDDDYFYTAKYLDNSIYRLHRNNKKRYLNVPENTLVTNAYLNITGNQNISYPVLSINEINVWNHSGNFITTETTNNLKDIINNYLSLCTIVNSVCQIPFVFHTEGNGTLNYSALLFSNEGFIENSITYNPFSTSGATETFVLNLSYDPNYYSGITVYLTYNNTNYTTSVSGLGNNYVFSSTITIPNVINSINKSFYFDVGLTNSSGTYYYHSTINNQTIGNFSIDNCTINSLRLFNISLKDEQSLNYINGTVEGWFVVYSLGTNSIVYTLNSSFNYITGSDLLICANNLTNSYKLRYDLKYYGNSSYYQKYRISQNTTISNATTLTQMPLYNLLSANGKVFTIILIGDLYTGSRGLLVDVQKKYLPSASYISVENTESDSNGNAILHLIEESEIYNFVVSLNGRTLKTFNDYKVQCQNSLTDECTITLNLASSSDSVTNYENYGNVSMSYSLDSTNNILYSYYVSNDGNSHTIEQNVIKDDGYGNTTICSSTSSGSSGTITCNIPAIYRNSSFYTNVYIDDEFVDTRLFSLGTNIFDNDMYDVDIIIEILLYCTLVLLFVSHPILIVIGGMLGMILSVILFFVTGGSMSSVIAILVYFIIGGILVLWQISKKF